MSRRIVLAGLVLAVLVAGCDREDPTAQFPSEPPTTATMPLTTAPQGAVCPIVVVECPRPSVTPGTVIASIEGICTRNYNPRRELSAEDKRLLLKAYDIRPGTKVAEWDHYEPRWAGGTSDTRNIWPMIDPVQADRKDALEDHDYRAVCVTRTMSLVEARYRAWSFWRYWAKSTTTTT